MLSGVKILLWERWRRTHLAFWVASLPPFLLWINYALKITLFSYFDKKVILFDLPVKPFWYTSFILLTGILLMGHSGTRNLNLGFPERLFRLPVSTFKLVAVHLGFGVSAVALLFLLYLSSNITYYGTIGLGWTHLLWFEAVYLILQTLSWAVGPVRLVSLVLPSTVFITLLFISESISASTGTAVLLCGVIIICCITSLRVVTACRKGSWLNNIPKEGYIFDILKRNPLKPFASPVHAQIWIEFRRTAYLLPIFTAISALAALLVFLINLIPGVSIFDSSYFDTFTSSLSISAVILFLIRYAILHRDRISGASEFWLRRPLPTHTLASSHILGLLRGFILSSVIITTVAISNALLNYWVSGSWDYSIFALAYPPEKFNSAFEYFTLNILGLYAFAVLFWSMLRLLHLLFAGTIIYLFVYVVMFLNLNMESAHLWLVNVAGVIACIAIPLLFLTVFRLRLVTLKTLLVSCCFYAVTVTALYTLKWDSIPDYLMQWYRLKIFAAAMVPFIPVAVTPFLLNRMRHR